MLVKKWMSRQIISVSPKDAMQDAIRTLKEHNIHLLPVLENDTLVGIISDGDLKKASPSDATSLDIHELVYLTSKIRIRDLMTQTVFTVPSDATIEEAAQILLNKKIHGLPVLDAANRVVGVITRSDIFRVLITITAEGKRGIQLAIRLPDIPGPLKEIRQIVRDFDARIASILSSTEGVADDFINVYLRIYQLDRSRLEEMLEAIKPIGTLLYMVDHRDDKRTIYETGIA
ncbi:MAG: hypothetical protein CSA22_09600 [Deltaproteobacteria bacterium]|nr:MAG: hypothetical protein CSA22_09600 [Deltaproteobacteria bacterium]